MEQNSKAGLTPKNPALILGMFAWALAYSTFNQGTTMIALPYEAKRLVPEKASAITGGICAAGSLCQVFGLVVCHFSDKTTFRWGRRRPYLLGAAIGAAGSAILWVFGNISNSIVGISFAFLLMWISISCGITVLEALMPDTLPEKQHGLAGGILGLLQVLGTAIAFALFSAEIPMWACMIVFGGLSMLLVLPTMLCAREKRFVPQNDDSNNGNVNISEHVCCQKTRKALYAFGFSPREHKDWLLLLIIRILFFIAVGYSSFTQFWIGDTLRITNSETMVANVGLVTLGACILSGLPAGFLSDKLGRKPFLIGSLGVMSGALLLMMFANNMAIIWVTVVLLGLGNGVYPSVEMAICCDCIPRTKDAGKFVAEFSVCQTVGQLIGQLVFGQTLQAFSVYRSDSGNGSVPSSQQSSSSNFVMMYDHMGYVAIFGISAGCLLVAFVLSLFLSPKRGKQAQEIANAKDTPPSSTEEDGGTTKEVLSAAETASIVETA